MKITVVVDEDVATLLQQVREARNLGLKEAVNEALRYGLCHLASPAPRGEPFRTRTVDHGACLIGSLDDAAEVLALAEGEVKGIATR